MGKRLEVKKGDQYGRLTVFKELETIVKPNGERKRKFLCNCICGNTKEVFLHDLRSGHVMSCGCLRKELTVKKNKKNNVYVFTSDCVIGYTTKGEPFKIDVDDYERIKTFCWSKDSNGYLSARINKKTVRLHRFLINTEKGFVIDHINRDKSVQNQVASRGVAAFPEAEKFLDEHKDIYGAILALDMASVQMNGGKYAEAQQYIKFARDNGGELIAPQASLVLARLQAETGDYNGAFASLDAIRSDAYAAEVSEIRGDIYMAQKDINKAHDSYQQAIKITRDNKLQISPILQMKFDNVIRDGDEPAYKIMAEQIAESQIVPVSE